MAFVFYHLDPTVRRLMLEEIQSDIDVDNLYFSLRLSPAGKAAYPGMLMAAANTHDEVWLTTQLSTNGILNKTAVTAKGSKRMPRDAARMLAEGEFNRFYIRALCRFAIDSSVPDLVIYRAKPVTSPRPESAALVGKLVKPGDTLRDLRLNVGVDTVFGLPPGPNSGLSVRIPSP